MTNNARINGIFGIPSMAALIETCTLYPLDIATTFSQLQHTQTRPNGVFQCVRTMAARRGITGMYRGLPVLTIGLLPLMAYRTLTYSTVTHHVNHNLSVTKVAGVGVIVGLLESIVITPLDHIKILQQTHTKPISVITMCRQLPFTSLFRALPETALRQSTYGCMTFFGIDYLQRYIQRDNAGLSGFQQLLGIVGVTCVAVTAGSPFDVLKTRVQAGQSQGERMSVIKNIWLKEGWRFGFRGLRLRLAQAGLGSGLTLIVHDFVRIAMEQD